MLCLTLGAGLALAACKTDEVAAGDCGASDLQYLQGQLSGALAGVNLPGMVRVIRPGDAVTKDYRLDRLNIYINEGDRIDQIICG